MQEHPGAPGTARQESTRTIVSTNDGGNATQPRAPGHERPRAAPRAARHGRLSAATGAPGADVPPATMAGAPGQHCLSAVPRAPGHERPRAAQCVARHGRLSAALRTPGADVPLATTAGAPGQHRLSAAPVATVSSPAGLRRLRQVILPRVPATPNTLTYPRSRPNTANYHAPYSSAPTHWISHHTTHQVHPAIQVPPRPRSCSTAGTGFLLRYSRAPPRPPFPSPAREAARGQVRPTPLSTMWRGAGGEAHPTYRPCHCGRRFSWKATSPSCASAVAPTRSKIVVATFKRS